MTMGDYAYGGAEEENLELKKLNAEVDENPDEFENWEKLVRVAESLEGGLNRNSSPQSIAAARNIYDRFLAKFPLFFGYWKKYADLEFAIVGTEAAEMIYERGVASITISVDLWTNYCTFKVETTHDPDATRELFERAANSVGLDFLAHPFWDKYIEFEERLDAHDKIFAILSRIVHVPMHQYARYFERYRQMAASRPIEELAPADVLAQLSAETAFPSKGQDSDRELRARLDAYHLELFQRTQTETTKRWTYEQEVKRPYFHVTELDEAQLSNWQKYLDFEEAEGDFTRVAFLYERCLVTAAHYDDFWHRYARWMYAREGKDEEVRNIFMRASCFYVPIAKPVIRLQWALFEEVSGRPSVAAAIYEAILLALPGHLEAIVGLASLQRRQEGIEAALAVYHQQLDSPQSSTHTKGALVAEMARLAYKAHGNVEDGRRVFQDQQNAYLDSQLFWSGYLSYELEQAVSMDAETQHYQRVRAVHDDIRRKSHLAPDIVKELSHRYMAYLTERGGKGAAKEYMDLDAEINGPASAIGLMRIKNTAETKSLAGLHPGAVPNGHAAA